MKKLVPLIAMVIFAACSKSNDAPANKQVEGEPSITHVSFYRVAAGGNESVGFTVDLVSDSNTVDKVVLYESPTLLAWEVKKPQTGRYIMYDHTGDYPTYAMNALYYFVFYKKDGSKVATEPFQVY